MNQYNKYMKILLDKHIYDHDLTIRQVSILTGVSKSTIHSIINHKVSPTMDTMERLAAGLKIKISDLYESEHK